MRSSSQTILKKVNKYLNTQDDEIPFISQLPYTTQVANSKHSRSISLLKSQQKSHHLLYQNT